MQHVTFADKSLLVGDEMAKALVRYATHIGRLRSADDVEVRAYGIDGEEVIVSVLLNSGTVLAAETTRSPLPEPDNSGTIAYIEVQMAQFDLPTG